MQGYYRPPAHLKNNKLLSRRYASAHPDGERCCSGMFIRNILLPQNGAEQGEDAQQRDERCHYTCQR
jgi:hypothetical protein